MDNWGGVVLIQIQMVTEKQIIARYRLRLKIFSIDTLVLRGKPHGEGFEPKVVTGASVCFKEVSVREDLQWEVQPAGCGKAGRARLPRLSARLILAS